MANCFFITLIVIGCFVAVELLLFLCCVFFIINYIDVNKLHNLHTRTHTSTSSPLIHKHYKECYIQYTYSRVDRREVTPNVI